MKPDPTILLELYIAGARLKPERSNAQPQEAYGDPAKTVRFASEKVKRKKKGRK